jgi:hypothetical protein
MAAAEKIAEVVAVVVVAVDYDGECLNASEGCS